MDEHSTNLATSSTDQQATGQALSTTSIHTNKTIQFANKDKASNGSVLMPPPLMNNSKSAKSITRKRKQNHSISKIFILINLNLFNTNKKIFLIIVIS
jgi:hypothetical protein